MALFSDSQLLLHQRADEWTLATRRYDFGSASTAIRHTNEIQPGDVARILCAVSKNMLPLLAHCYSPPNALWYRDHHYQKYGSYRNNSAVCKDRGCLCCKQKKKGLSETHCEYCLGAHVLSTVNKETSRVVKTDDRVWNWWAGWTPAYRAAREAWKAGKGEHLRAGRPGGLPLGTVYQPHEQGGGQCGGKGYQPHGQGGGKGKGGQGENAAGYQPHSVQAAQAYSSQSHRAEGDQPHTANASPPPPPPPSSHADSMQGDQPAEDVNPGPWNWEPVDATWNKWTPAAASDKGEYEAIRHTEGSDAGIESWSLCGPDNSRRNSRQADAVSVCSDTSVFWD